MHHLTRGLDQGPAHALMLSLGLLIKHSTLLLVVLERLVVVLLLLALLALRSRRTEGCAGDNSRAGRLL